MDVILRLVNFVQSYHNILFGFNLSKEAGNLDFTVYLTITVMVHNQEMV